MSSPHGSVCRHPFCAGAHGTQWRPRAQAGRRPPPSRRSAVRPYLPDFRLHPPAIPQGALHILRQFSACARRHPAGARRVLTCQISVCVRPPARRARCTSCASSPPAPAAVPQGRARYVIRRISACVRPPSRRDARGTSFAGFPPASARHPAGARCVLTCRISACVRRQPAGTHAASCARFPPASAAIPWGALRAIPQDGFRHSHGQQRRGRHGPSAVELARCGSAHFTVSAHSPEYAAAAARSLRISRSGNQARIPAAVRSPRLPLGRRGGGSLSLCRLAQPPRYAARTRSSARTSAAAPDMVIMPVPST